MCVGTLTLIPALEGSDLDGAVGMVEVLLGAVAGGALLPHGVQDLTIHASDAQPQVL